jgi:hypothetical protein
MYLDPMRDLFWDMAETQSLLLAGIEFVLLGNDTSALRLAVSTIVLTYVPTTPNLATCRVFFSNRQAGKHTEQDSWIEPQLAPGEYAAIFMQI